jgi:hypothetical protein
MIFACLILLAAVFFAVLIANCVRYRRVTRTPGYITHPKGQRRLP